MTGPAGSSLLSVELRTFIEPDGVVFTELVELWVDDEQWGGEFKSWPGERNGLHIISINGQGRYQIDLRCTKLGDGFRATFVGRGSPPSLSESEAAP